MRIGIPKEMKNNENRVGMTPAGVAELTKHGHTVYVQHTAGENSGFSDEEYEKVGAELQRLESEARGLLQSICPADKTLTSTLKNNKCA